jgi:hypothetical protein
MKLSRPTSCGARQQFRRRGPSSSAASQLIAGLRPSGSNSSKAMGQGARASRAAIGLTVKSGWAAVVLLTGSPTSPRVVDSSRIDLSDPAIPESRQPYHAGFGTARDGGPELSRLLRSVRQFGRQSVTGLIRQYRIAGHQLAGAGVVVGSMIDPAQIVNDHIRIHALEGQLFRTVVEDAAVRNRLPCSIWRERDLYAVAAAVVKQPERRLRDALAALRRGVAGSWRAEQKTAALAAWLVLTERPRATRTIRRRRSAA